MKTYPIIWKIIGIVIIIGGIFWFMNGRNSIQSKDTQTGEVKTENPITSKQTFQSIITQKGNYECTYESISASTKSSNVLYIADGKIRGEFRTTTGSGSSANLMLYSTGILYTWKEGATTGKKMAISSLSQLPSVIPADLTSGAILGSSANNVSWDCHSWARDPKLLVPPTYVKFY